MTEVKNKNKILCGFNILIYMFPFLLSYAITVLCATTQGVATASSVQPVGTTGNVKQDQMAALQQNSMLKTALNQITATQMGDKDAKKFIPGYNGKNLYCDSRGVDGNWAVIDKQIQNDCVQQKKEKKEKAEQPAKELVAPKSDDCKVRISKESMVCHVRKVMNNVIKDPFYIVNLYGNVLEVLLKKKPVFMGIMERFRYNAKKLKNVFKNSPTATFRFNRLGGLLSQTGEVPQPNKFDPCASCLDALKQKSESVDGNNNN